MIIIDLHNVFEDYLVPARRLCIYFLIFAVPIYFNFMYIIKYNSLVCCGDYYGKMNCTDISV